MNQWIKCIIVLSIIPGIILFSGMEDEFFAWGDDGICDPDLENLNITIFHGGEDGEHVADDKEEDPGPGAFTFGYLKDPDADTPYAFELMKLIVCKPPQEAIEKNPQTMVKLTMSPGKDGKALFLDQAQNELGTECEFLPADLPPFLWIKVTKPSARWRDITICASFLEECEDTVKATAVAIDGKFRIIGDQNAAPYYHEEPLVGVTEEDETFFRTLGGMRLHLKVTLPPDDVEEYAWGTTGGDFFQNYSSTAQPLAPAASKGSDLKDLYWEGAYSPDLDVMITLMLTIQGMENPLKLTRQIKSRVLRQGMKGDDVAMLQAYLRQIGLSERANWGYRGTPVTIDRDFGGKTSTALARMQRRDQIGQDSVVGKDTLAQIQLHWTDYLEAFEVHQNLDEDYRITITHTDFDKWLNKGSIALAETYKDEFVIEGDPQAHPDPEDPTKCIGCNESRKGLLRAWIDQESIEGIHWGYQNPYRIVLGGWDNMGSIGFSQIQNRWKYGTREAKDVLKNVNLYEPGDNIKGFGVWGDKGGGEGFYHAFISDRFNKCIHQSQAYPKLDDSYFDTNDCYRIRTTDKLAKGLMGYKEGLGVANDAGTQVLFNEIWPEMLRTYPNQNRNVNKEVKRGIEYALEVQNNPKAGFTLSNRTWTWIIGEENGQKKTCDYSEADWFSGTSWTQKCGGN